MVLPKFISLYCVTSGLALIGSQFTMALFIFEGFFSTLGAGILLGALCIGVLTENIYESGLQPIPF